MTKQQLPLSEILAMFLLVLCVPLALVLTGNKRPPEVVINEPPESLLEVISVPEPDKETYEATIRELQSRLFTIENIQTSVQPVIIVKNRLTHIVQPGENLSIIAKKYRDQDATVDNLREYNKENVLDTNNIVPGQMLTIFEVDDIIDNNEPTKDLRGTYAQQTHIDVTRSVEERKR